MTGVTALDAWHLLETPGGPAPRIDLDRCTSHSERAVYGALLASGRRLDEGFEMPEGWTALETSDTTLVKASTYGLSSVRRGRRTLARHGLLLPIRRGGGWFSGVYGVRTTSLTAARRRRE